MKSAFPCYYMATKMLMKAGIQPRGDVRLAGVVGEIERAPIGAHQGAECRGAGLRGPLSRQPRPASRCRHQR